MSLSLIKKIKMVEADKRKRRLDRCKEPHARTPPEKETEIQNNGPSRHKMSRGQKRKRERGRERERERGRGRERGREREREGGRDRDGSRKNKSINWKMEKKCDKTRRGANTKLKQLYREP